jgi:excisionase family DNA binding protein
VADDERKVPRLALSVAEAAEALSVSRDFFDEHIRHELRLVRRGRKILVPVRELERWLEQNGTAMVDRPPRVRG